MSLHRLILWNQVDIPQEHLRGDHAHVRLWTRLYGNPEILIFEEAVIKFRRVKQFVEIILMNILPYNGVIYGNDYSSTPALNLGGLVWQSKPR